MRAGHFYLELKGLAPGKYHYKYIIDNTWAVDGLAPKVLDSQVSRHACLLAFACFCLLLLAFACFCLLLLAFACFCLLLLAFACFCLLLLAWKVGGTCAQYGGRGGGGCCHYKYIINNTWAVDGLAPKVLDSQVGGIVFEGWGVCCVWVGGCHYQYIIDNTWAVDGLAPKVLDSQVNRNCLGRGGPLELGG
jgi:hypothetical protein